NLGCSPPPPPGLGGSTAASCRRATARFLDSPAARALAGCARTDARRAPTRETARPAALHRRSTRRGASCGAGSGVCAARHSCGPLHPTDRADDGPGGRYHLRPMSSGFLSQIGDATRTWFWFFGALFIVGVFLAVGGVLRTR